MKKCKYLVALLTILFALPITVKAASASISIKTSGTAVVGNTITANVTVSSATPMGSWQFLVSYDTSRLKLISGQTSVADYTSSVSGVKSKTYTLKFQALRNGNASINVGSYLVYAIDESAMSVSPSNATIKIMTQAELEATYSKDNNLKNLSVEGYELTPAFDKDTLEYSTTVPSTVDKVNIIATKNDSTARVEGAGEKEVVEGNNPFDIVVTAQNGSTKTYKVIVNVEDINPIQVDVANGNYTIVKRKDSLETPTGFEETTVVINDIEIPAYKNDTLGLTLVGIKDEEGKISYAIYKDGKYELYNELKSNQLILYALPLKEGLKGLIKTTITINGQEIEAYKFSKNSKFAIIYGKSIETGEESYYMYDEKENTYQRYNAEQIDALQEQLQIYLYVIYAFSGCLLLIFICFIISKIAKKKSKKRRNKTETENKNQEIIDDFLEEKKKGKKK